MSLDAEEREALRAAEKLGGAPAARDFIAALPCTGCYTGEPHACPNAVREPVTREVTDADLRDRLRRLEAQFGALVREHAYLRASIPDLDDLRRVKDLVSVPDYYIPLETVWVRANKTETLVAPVHVSAYLRGFVVSVGSDELEVCGLFLGSFNCASCAPNGRGPRLSAFQAVMAEQKTWRVHCGVTITLQLQNPTSHDVVFSGAFVLKEASTANGEASSSPSEPR